MADISDKNENRDYVPFSILNESEIPSVLQNSREDPRGELSEAVKRGLVHDVREVLERLKVLEKLELNIDESDENGKTVLMEAAMRDNITILYLLIYYGADPNKVDKDGKTALMYAAINDIDYMILLLVKNGADFHKVDKDGKTALIYAVINDCEESLDQLLINCEVELNEDFDKLLTLAKENDDETIYSMLCNKKRQLEINRYYNNK